MPAGADTPSTPLIPSVDWPHAESDLLPDPSVRFGRLPSGVRYALLPNHHPRDRVVMHLVVEAGSLHEAEDQRGLAHFLEHMMFNGSTHFPPGELVKYFQSIGMAFGGDANASTSFTQTVYDIVLPEGGEAALDKALTVFSDYAQGALLLPAEIDRERGVILAEKMSRDSPDWRTYVAELGFQMAGTRLPDRLPIGDAAVVSESDRGRFKAFYDTWYRPEAMTVVMVGDMDVEVAERLVAKHFGGMTARAPEGGPIEVGAVGHQGTRVFHHHEPDSGATRVAIEAIQNAPPIRDDAAFRQEEIEAHVVNRMLQHRLDRMVGEADSPMTDASVGSGTFLDRFRYAGIEAACEADRWTAALGQIDAVLRQALTHGFQENELERVRQEVERELEQAVLEEPTRESRTIARDLLYALRTRRVFRSPTQDRDFWLPRLQALTPEQAHERLQAVWAADHRLVSVTGNTPLLEDGTPPEERILAAYTAALSRPVDPPAVLEPVAFPYLPTPDSPGRTAAEIRDDDLGIQRITFSNGVHLQLKPTDFTQGEVLFTLAFGEGRSGEPAGLPGIADLAAAVLNESGLGGLRKSELERATAGIQTRVVFGVREDHFFFAGRSVPGEERNLLERLYAHLVDPAFRQEALDLVLERIRQDHHALKRSVDGAMELYGDRFLAGGDSRFGEPPLASVGRIHLEDIRGWLEPLLAGEPLELSVVGDFDPEAVKRWSGLYLGSLPNRSAASVPDYRTPVFPQGQRLDIQVETGIDKAMVVVAYPTVDQWDIGRTRRLNVLGDVFAERLREEVREKLGAAYSPYAYNRPSRAYEGFGSFLAVAEVDPAQVDPVREVLLGIGRSLAEEGVDPQELQRALEPTRTSIKEMLRKNRYWLNTVLRGASRHPQQLDWSRTILADYGSITPEEISEFARTYLAGGRPAVVTVRPGPS